MFKFQVGKTYRTNKGEFIEIACVNRAKDGSMNLVSFHGRMFNSETGVNTRNGFVRLELPAIEDALTFYAARSQGSEKAEPTPQFEVGKYYLHELVDGSKAIYKCVSAAGLTEAHFTLVRFGKRVCLVNKE